MSQVHERPSVGYNVKAAGTYNYRSSRKLNLPKSIPNGLLLKYPALTKNWRSTTKNVRKAISDAVFLLQGAELGLSPHDCDGAWGPTTHRLVAKKFQPVERHERHLVVSGRRVPLKRTGYTHELHGLDDKRNKTDLHRSGNFGKKRTRAVKQVVIHWGGRDRGHLYRYFSGTDKSVSSHGSASGGIASQMLDLDFIAYHAGRGDDRASWNADTVGYDCAQFSEASRVDWYRYKDGDPYDDIHPISNPERDRDRRGMRKMLSLDTRTALAMRELIFDTLEVLGLEPKAPRGKDGIEDEGPVFYGVLPKRLANKHGITVVGHHHIRRTKPDIIGWWDAIFGGTVLGD